MSKSLAEHINNIWRAYWRSGSDKPLLQWLKEQIRKERAK